jgi:hypothetical protein
VRVRSSFFCHLYTPPLKVLAKRLRNINAY